MHSRNKAHYTIFCTFPLWEVELKSVKNRFDTVFDTLLGVGWGWDLQPFVGWHPALCQCGSDSDPLQSLRLAVASVAR